MQKHTGQHPEFLRPKDLLMLDKARLEGDVGSLHEHIRLIEDSLPTVQATRPQAADDIVQRRLPYLRQVVAELTLQSQVLAAATARVHHAQNGAAGDAAPAVHATSTAWQKWQRVAEALGYTVSENGTLHEHSEGTRDVSQSTGSNSGSRQQQQQNQNNHNQLTQAAATATVTAPEVDPQPNQQQKPVLRAVDGNNASDLPSMQENLSNRTMDQLTDTLIPREAFEEEGEASYLEAFAVHCMDCTTEDAAKMPWKTLSQAVSSGVPENVLEGLLWPCTPAEFAASIRQHSALLIQRESSRSFYSGIFSSEELWKLLKEREVQYGTNVDVTLFTAEQRRQTFNDNQIKGQPADGHGAGGGQRKSKKRKRNGATQAQQTDSETTSTADAAVVGQRYNSGCSVRLLHPQQWVPSVAQLLAPMEQLLQCPLGCNVYLTPADSQGFAPHFDDVDVYILQVEGAKRWRVYAPLSGHALPRYSSRDFDDMEIGEPLLDTVLRPGDLLYLPRGTIHQAAALPGHHSMHLTVSAEQRRTWADFMETALQEALEETRKTCFAARASMSPWLYQCCGMLHSNRLCPTSRDMPSECFGGKSSLPASVLANGEKNGKSMNSRKEQTDVGLVRSDTFEKFQKLPGSSSLLEPSELRQLRTAFSCTVDRLMHAMRRSMHAALDRAADRAAAKFTTERLPPLWLQGAPQNSENQGPNELKSAHVNLRAAYDEGNGEQAAADLRIPAAILAVLLDSGDPECLEVRHCMNNSCDQHALAAAAGNIIGPPTSGHANQKDLEEPQELEDDVLKLPFFLIPRSIGPEVAKRLLNIKRCERSPVNGSSDAKFHSSSTKGSFMHAVPGDVGVRDMHAVQKKQKNGKKAKRGHACEAEKSCQALKVATQGLHKDYKGEVIGEEVWEAGSGWAEWETNAQEGDAEDAEESKELVTEVECTLADLGIWVQ